MPSRTRAGLLRLVDPARTRTVRDTRGHLHRAAQAIGPAQGERQVILLAWGDELSARGGAACLRRAGFEVAVAARGAQALEFFMGHDPALILLDTELPDATGARVCAALRGLPSGLEVPVLVAYEDDEDVDQALSAGATDVVRKPVNWHIASRRASSLARAGRAVDELARTQARLDRVERRPGAAHQKLTRLSTIDRLTGLPNRVTFHHYLDHALANGGDSEGTGAVLYLDLDRFQEINETLARRGGDEILKQVAERLRTCLKAMAPKTEARPRPRAPARATHPAKTVTRFGQDEFGLMLTGVRAEDVNRLVRIVLHTFKDAFLVGQTEVFLSASVGIALFPTDRECGAERVVQNAETAMYEAKRRVPGSYSFYNESFDRGIERKQELHRRMHWALERHEFVMHYQPILDASTRRWVAVEALLRWRHPELGWVSPAEFIPLAEETALMVPIGTWVLRTACRQLRSWLDSGMAPVRLAVNVSTCQIEWGDLAYVVGEVLGETGLRPELLELELSERGVLHGEPQVRRLEKLKSLGVRLSMDDFGAGHSAITYLKHLPLDCLKIDQNLVHGIGKSREDAAITQAVLTLAQHLHLGVIAEGVETVEQFEFLRRNGCHAFQGFLFSPALSAVEVPPRLADLYGLMNFLPETTDTPGTSVLP